MDWLQQSQTIDQRLWMVNGLLMLLLLQLRFISCNNGHHLPCRILVAVAFVVEIHLTYTLKHTLVPPTAVDYHHAGHNSVSLLDLLIPVILVVEVDLPLAAVADAVEYASI